MARLTSGAEPAVRSAARRSMISSRALIRALNSASFAARLASRAANIASVAVLNAIHSVSSSRRGSSMALATACHCACSLRTLSTTSRAATSDPASSFALAMSCSRCRRASPYVSLRGASSLHRRRVTTRDRLVPVQRLARHGVLHRPQLAPGDLRFLQGAGYRPPVGPGRRCRGGDRGVVHALCGVLRRQIFRRRLDQTIHYPIARGKILVARALDLVEMRCHRRVGGFQRAVEGQPHRLLGRAPELIQFLPPLPQPVYGRGVLLDRNLPGRGTGQLLRLGRELLAALPPAPALPLSQAKVLATQ